MSEFTNYENRIKEQGCPVKAYQHVSVSVPISVNPYARVGRVRIHCNGNSAISAGDMVCGNKDGSIHFVVSQSFCVEIPVNFGASVNVGDTYVNEENASAALENNEENCDDILL